MADHVHVDREGRSSALTTVVVIFGILAIMAALWFLWIGPSYVYVDDGTDTTIVQPQGDQPDVNVDINQENNESQDTSTP